MSADQQLTAARLQAMTKEQVIKAYVALDEKSRQREARILALQNDLAAAHRSDMEDGRSAVQRGNEARLERLARALEREGIVI